MSPKNKEEKLKRTHASAHFACTMHNMIVVVVICKRLQCICEAPPVLYLKKPRLISRLPVAYLECAKGGAQGVWVRKSPSKVRGKASVSVPRG